MSAPPMPLEGDRRQMHGPLWIYEAEIEPRDSDSYMPSKTSLWNSSEDTQYRVTFTLEEPNITVLQGQELEPGKIQALLYPGEAKEVFLGSYARHSCSMQFGTPDQSWLNKKAEQDSKETQVEIDAVKALVRMYPAPGNKYTADYIANLCESYNIPFVDLTFPPKPTPSMYREFENSPFKKSVYPWKRPHNYIKDVEANPPGLWVGKIEPADIDQGQIGDCYLCCAIAGLAETPWRVERVYTAPRNPDLGVYRMLMCKSGWRHSVTVDDMVPTRSDLPVFAKNRNELNELWVALFEKCFAKMYGSYQALAGGSPPHAVADFLGTPFTRFRDHPAWDEPNKERLFAWLEKADREKAIITISTPGSDTTDYAGTGGGGGHSMSAEDVAAKYKSVGLVAGHAFTVLRVRRYNGHRLMCIRNPWGGDTEWNGKWSDHDPNWTEDMKQALGFTAEDDGTFWMDIMDCLGPNGWFDGGAVNYTLDGWSCVRVAGNYDRGIPDVIMRITVAPGTEPVRVHMGVHQKDTRGMRAEDARDNKYVAILNAFVRPHQPGSQHTRGFCEIVAQSGESFMSARDVFAETELAPCPDASMPYYAVPLCYSECERSFVTTLWFSRTDNVTVEFVAFKGGLEKRIMHPANFVPSQCTQKVSANIQVETPRMKGRWVNQEAHIVDWNAMPGDMPPPASMKTLSNLSRAHEARQRAVQAAEGAGLEQVKPLQQTKPAGHAAPASADDSDSMQGSPSMIAPPNVAQQRIMAAAQQPQQQPTRHDEEPTDPNEARKNLLGRPQYVDPSGNVGYAGGGGGGGKGPQEQLRRRWCF